MKTFVIISKEYSNINLKRKTEILFTITIYENK